MSPYGTKREFGQGHFQVGKPTHCRPPTPSVGLGTTTSLFGAPWTHGLHIGVKS